MKKHYLFVPIPIDEIDEDVSIRIDNYNLFDDFDKAFESLENFAEIAEIEEDIKAPKRPGPFNHSTKNWHLQIWETILPENPLTENM